MQYLVTPILIRTGKLRQIRWLMRRPPTLRLTQALAVAIARNDKTAVLQGLDVLMGLINNDHEGEVILRQLNINSSPTERFWFGNLDGPRKLST